MFTGYVSLGNNFYCYLRKPLRCRGPGQLPSLPPPLNPALVRGVLEAKPEVEVWRQPDLLTRYDTIRDAIITCARKPTWIGLIYRTEATTKNCKTEKRKSKSRYVRSNSKSLANHVVRSEKKKKKGCSGKDLQKKVLSLEWKREWVIKNNNN